MWNWVLKATNFVKKKVINCMKKVSKGLKELGNKSQEDPTNLAKGKSKNYLLSHFMSFRALAAQVTFSDLLLFRIVVC